MSLTFSKHVSPALPGHTVQEEISLYHAHQVHTQIVMVLQHAPNVDVEHRCIVNQVVQVELITVFHANPDLIVLIVYQYHALREHIALEMVVFLVPVLPDHTAVQPPHPVPFVQRIASVSALLLTPVHLVHIVLVDSLLV